MICSKCNGEDTVKHTYSSFEYWYCRDCNDEFELFDDLRGCSVTENTLLDCVDPGDSISYGTRYIDNGYKLRGWDFHTFIDDDVPSSTIDNPDMEGE